MSNVIEPEEVAPAVTYRILATIDECQHENPVEWSDEREIYSFSTRHRSFMHPDEFGLHEGPWGTTSSQAGLRRKLDTGTAFILSCYQHSGISWSLKGEGMQDRFDTARVAGILFQKGKRRETYEQRAERARQWLDIYNAWCNGEVYRVELQSYVPGEEDDAKDLETSSGHYGYDDVKMWADEVCKDRCIENPGVTFA